MKFMSALLMLVVMYYVFMFGRFYQLVETPKAGVSPMQEWRDAKLRQIQGCVKDGTGLLKAAQNRARKG